MSNNIRLSASEWTSDAVRMRHDCLKNDILFNLEHCIEQRKLSAETLPRSDLYRWSEGLAQAYQMAGTAIFKLSPARCLEISAFESVSAEELRGAAAVLDGLWRGSTQVEKQLAAVRRAALNCLEQLEWLFQINLDLRDPDETMKVLVGLRSDVYRLVRALEAIDTSGRLAWKR